MDTDGARKLPGVQAVIGADDIPGENQIGPIIPDEPLLAEAEVHYAGQPVALVLADSADIARAGVRLIRMEHEALPVITDPRDAFARGEIIGATRTFESGNVDAVWATCAHVVEGRCDVGGQDHVYLETHRSRAVPLEGGRMRVFSSTQSPYAGQKAIARILDVPHNHVEVEVKRLGGGFGGKEDQATPWACLAALGAWHTGRPVEVVLRRSEDMAMTGKRHPYSSDFKIGADADGKILAYSVRHFQNAGAAADLSPAVLERTLFHSTNSYFIPNVRAFAASCRTNLPPNTAFRGFGGPQGMFVIECAIARLAESMGRPREHIQRINLLQDGDTFPYGQVVRDGRATPTWQQAEERFDLNAIKDRISKFNESHFGVKKGFAVMPICFGISFTTTFMNQAGALVHVYTDGSVSVSTGGVEMGQGLVANINRIAATALGIAPERIRIESTNTTRVANMSPSAASSTTMLNGNATLVAIGQIMDRLAKVAREELGAPETADITIEDEHVLCDGENTSMTWSDLVLAAHLRRVDLSAHGFFATPGIHFDKGRERGHPFAYHTYGTAIVEVTVDCLRGTYDVDNVSIVHDLGRPLNRLVDIGQIEGGLAQGLGWMTMEDLRYDDSGQLITGALATYKVPDAYFMPDDIQIEFLRAAEEALGPYGSKAVGEPPLMYGIGVYFALRRAMHAFRPDLDFKFEAPLTPERLLLAIHPELAARYSGVTVAAVEPASS
jgi:xanthine dehydrogenase large subunit